MKTPNLKLSFLFWLLMSSLMLQAQRQKKMDSLLAVLKSTSNDTTKVNMYGQICRFYAVNKGDFNLANKYLDSVRILSNSLQYKNGILHSFFLQGLLNNQSGNYTEALNNYQKASSGYLKKGDSSRAFSAIQGMAQVYSTRGDYEKSLELLLSTADFHERKNALYPLAVSFTSIANILRKIEKYEESKKYHRKSLDILKAQGRKPLYAMGLQNLANVYAATGDNEKALELYEEALQIIQQTGNKHREAFVLGNMGYLFGELNQLEKAIEYQLKSANIWKTLSQQNNAVESLDNLGSLHLKLKKYDQALSYHTEALSLAKEAGNRAVIPEIYNGLSKVYAAKGEHKNAYIFNNRFWLLKDSLFNVEKSQQISELQTKYETEKKDQQITLLAQEKEIQKKETQRQATLKNVFIGGAILIALLAGLLFYTFRQRLKNQKAIASKNEEIAEVNFKRQLTELEMKALQAQINPHFIFNCLSSINQMILDGDNKNASKYLNKFSKLIRMILENAEEAEVSLKNELDLLEAYIQLESLRFEGDIKYEIEVSDDLDKQNTYLPSMVLQPFVENAIWHGLRHRTDARGGKVSISVAQKENEIVCRIEDNGVGRQKAFELQQKSVYKTKSMGLKITEDRLKLLSNELQKQLVRITDKTDKTGEVKGTLVEVLIPIT